MQSHVLQRTSPAVLVLALLPSLPAFSTAADRVTFLGGKEGKQTLTRTGTVEDYTGRELVITTAAGKRETITGEKVLKVETSSTKEEQSGDALKREGKLDEATQAYRQAKQAEPRAWVVRRIMARLVGCYDLQGDVDSAGDEFLDMLARDPDSPDFAAIPLAWRTSERTKANQSSTWLAASEPAAKLLGASWLLLGDQQAQAVKTLQSLSKDRDPRIANLAQAQLWRAALSRASSDDVRSWREEIERMPARLRSGPLLVVGDGLMRTGQTEDALLAWLAVPLVHSERETLCGQGFLAAAQAMEQPVRPGDANRLYRELADKYPSFARMRGLNQGETRNAEGETRK